MENFEQFAREFSALSNEPEIDIKISPLAAWCLISQIQLAVRHPANNGITAKHAKDIAVALQSRVTLSKSMQDVMALGWHKEYDASINETPQEFFNRVPQPEIVEVHNAYALYSSEDGHEGMIMTSRPQDWANKSQWAYERFKFEWLFNNQNHHLHPPFFRVRNTL